MFDNTESKEITKTDERTLANVIRMGNFTLSEIANNEETHFYEGEANPVTVTVDTTWLGTHLISKLVTWTSSLMVTLGSTYFLSRTGLDT